MKTQTIESEFSVLTVAGILNKFSTIEEARESVKNFNEGDFQISEWKGKEFICRYEREEGDIIEIQEELK